MLAFLYIVLCFLTGYCIVNLVFPRINEITSKTFYGDRLELSALFMKLPAYYVTGTLLLTWIAYITACVFSGTEKPLAIGDAVSFVTGLCVVLVSLYILSKRKEKHFREELMKIRKSEVVALFLVCVLVIFLMFRTLYSRDGQLCVGLSVFSDFSTHLSMIRSFSHGSNFPTQYSFFGGQDVKYHFMFQFLTGNLEYLGMRIDLAFNISSILSMLSVYMLLYVLALKISGKRGVGFITWGLFTFRSSWSLLEYIKSIPEGEVIKTLAENTEFIGSTENENWGLWNLNVYCNQRHLAFSLAVMLFVLLLMLPCLYEAGKRLKECISTDAVTSDQENKRGFWKNLLMSLKTFFSDSLFSKAGWLVRDFRTPVFAGILLGAIGFWNGAVLIGTVIVLFFMAAGSDRRLEFVILAFLAGVLSLVQSNIFIDGSLFEPKYYYGFLSQPKTFFGSLEFVWKLMGILPLLLLIAFAFVKGVEKYVMLCFSMPIIFSFTVSLTPDISVNHKYIMMAIMLLDIFAAYFVFRMFSERNTALRIIASGILACLMLTGIYEFMIVIRKNNYDWAMKYDYNDDIMSWVWENTDSKDLFLTGNYYLTYGGTGSSMILSGAMLFDGWQYFSWSAGYNSAERDAVVAAIYSCNDIRRLYEMVDEQDIRYIVIDERNRETDDYKLNEHTFDLAYEMVFTSGEDFSQIKIYDTEKKLLNSNDFIN